MVSPAKRAHVYPTALSAGTATVSLHPVSCAEVCHHGVTVHGHPGESVQGTAGQFAAGARRGALFEGVATRALESWLAACPGEFHLFHDLTGLQAVSGHGYREMGFGASNIDHVILSRAGWMLVDAKGTGAGTLTVDSQGRGVLLPRMATIKPSRGWTHAGTTRAWACWCASPA